MTAAWWLDGWRQNICFAMVFNFVSKKLLSLLKFDNFVACYRLLSHFAAYYERFHRSSLRYFIYQIEIIMCSIVDISLIHPVTISSNSFWFGKICQQNYFHRCISPYYIRTVEHKICLAMHSHRKERSMNFHGDEHSAWHSFDLFSHYFVTESRYEFILRDYSFRLLSCRFSS